MGGKSDQVRYNSELAVLAAFTGAASIDDIPKSALKNPSETKAAIEKIRNHYNDIIFQKWYDIALSYKKKILAHHGALPQKYDWVAGANAGDVADLVFVDFPISGISIKDSGGITLANLTPKALGLDPLPGNDVFYHYAPDEFVNFKTQVFHAVIAEAKANPDQTIIPVDRYAITYNSESDDFTVIYKKSGKLTPGTYKENDFFTNIEKNQLHHRVFGDWFQAHFKEHKNLMKPLVVKISKQFTEIIGSALESNEGIRKILQFEEKPYYYATPNSIYFVPGAADAADIKLKGVSYANPDGTSQLFKTKIGNDDSDDGAIIDIYIRYANGLFACNPTARVQSLKHPEFIAWDEL